MIKSLSTQEEIDALGGGKTIRDWEARFELAYEKCKDENVTIVEGIPNLLLPLAHPQDFGNLGRRPDCCAGGVHD